MKKRRKRRAKDGKYTFSDLLGDILFALPEIIIFPFRIIFYLIRGLFRNIFDFFN
ncbi:MULTISPECIES: hypothetical protein [Fredinandcohnia]|uniref:Uncharacterized protein n=1 Tax=Fredinandcohnia salidurans TaxID=2595041 RepID=A0ABW4MJW6_9BACI|nr:hypothetical protein [Fredinandcohnia onubensis]